VKKIYLLTLIVCLLFCTFLFIPGCGTISLPDGTSAHATSSSVIRKCFPEANAKINIHTSGTNGSVVLWQGLFDGPILLIPGPDPQTIICVYDYDTEIILLKIKTAKKYDPTAIDEITKSVLFTSTWDIRLAPAGDRAYVISYLEHISFQTFSGFRLPSSTIRFKMNGTPTFMLHCIGAEGYR
jgi:hypothetical protein